MNSRTVFALFAVLFVSLVCADAQSTWAYCAGTGAGILDVSSVTLNPDPPVLGTSDRVTLNGTVSQVVSGGNIALTITYYGIPVFSNTYQICDGINACPYQPGVLTASVTIDGQSLPVGAPSGNYVGEATVTDQNGATLACVDVTFTI